MPCGYDYNAYYMTCTPDGRWTWTATNKDKGFENRLGWIGKCASIAGGILHHFDYIKANTSRYFFETYVVYAPKRYDWGWGIAAMELAFHTCYFLGSFPNYWNVQNRRIVFAHDLMTPNVYPISKTPTLLEHYVSDYEKAAFAEIAETFGKQNLTDYFYPQLVPTERYAEGEEQIKATRAAIDKALFEFTTFYKKYELEHYLLQSFDLDARQKRFRTCVAATWPKPIKPYTPKPITPTAPPPVTGIPMDEIQKPTPEISPGLALPQGATRFTLTFNYGLKPGTPANILQLYVWLEQTW